LTEKKETSAGGKKTKKEKAESKPKESRVERGNGTNLEKWVRRGIACVGGSSRCVNTELKTAADKKAIKKS